MSYPLLKTRARCSDAAGCDVRNEEKRCLQNLFKFDSQTDKQLCTAKWHRIFWNPMICDGKFNILFMIQVRVSKKVVNQQEHKSPVLVHHGFVPPNLRYGHKTNDLNASQTVIWNSNSSSCTNPLCSCPLSIGNWIKLEQLSDLGWKHILYLLSISCKRTLNDQQLSHDIVEKLKMWTSEILVKR